MHNPATLLLLLVPVLAGLVSATGGDQDLLRGFRHIGDDETPEWPEASVEPDSPSRLELAFHAERNREERALVMTHRHVDGEWGVRVNGTRVATLRRGEEIQTHYYPVPAGVLLDGINTLTVSIDRVGDDITIGDITLLQQSFREVMQIGDLAIEVVDQSTGAPMPARLTLVDGEGNRTQIYYANSIGTAVRAGVLYTRDGVVAAGLPAGRYTVWAARGMEWSAASEEIVVRSGGKEAVRLELSREVDTAGFVAADTHVHTYTISGHGDSTLEERMITLAGEGVELPIATDHNHNTDYRPFQKSTQTTRWFTPVVGNEVSTDLGHFNAFPLDPEDDVPEYKVKDWEKLVEGIRSKGARVVILNHPRWPNAERGPFGVFRLDRATGERQGPRFTFDAVEVFNSTCPETHPDLVLQDWFAVLRYGERITAVGSSDSHTVNDMVGEGRTYVASSAVDMASIDIDEACASFLAGTSSVSMGCYAEVRFEGAPVMGQVLPTRRGTIQLEVRAAAASWAQCETVTLYVDGREVEKRRIPKTKGKPLDQNIRFRVKTGGKDVFVVAVVRGKKPEQPFWDSLMPYIAAATNPVWIDGDGDGLYTHPRAGWALPE